MGPTVILKLTENNQRRVSSHFERLIAAEHVEGLLTKWRAEERERVAAAERRRAEERARAAEAEQAAAAHRLRITEDQLRREQERLQMGKKTGEDKSIAGESDSASLTGIDLTHSPSFFWRRSEASRKLSSGRSPG